MIPETSGALHVAIIMDGNGRWAKQKDQDVMYGHHKGSETLKSIVKSCPVSFVRYLTVYAFSSENWKRDKKEVDALMDLFEHYLDNETEELHKEGVCLRIIGERSRLSKRLQNLIAQAEALTLNNTRLGLQVAVGYGGRDDILNAVRTIARLVKGNELDPEAITSEHINKALWTHPWPDPDLLIRTGGEIRLSNYLLWQLSYTELTFSSKCWPDFTFEDFEAAINEYRKRKRLFGSSRHCA